VKDKQCWLCHRGQEEILKWAKENYNPSEENLASEISYLYDDKKDVFLEVDVLDLKIILCPVCYHLLESILDWRYFEERFDEQLKKYYATAKLKLIFEDE
jgi:hypothetical protein